MFDPQRTARIGFAILAGVAIGVLAVVSFDGLRLSKRHRVEVFFEHTAELAEGADVQIAGRVVGQVKSIQLVTGRQSAGDPEHPLAGDSGVRVLLDIEDKHIEWTSLNGEVFINSKGVIGERYLELGPPPGVEPRDRPLQDGDRVRGIDPPQLDRVLAQGFMNLMASKRFLNEISPAASELAEAWRELAKTLEEAEPTPGAYDQLSSNFSALSDEIGTLASDLREADFDAADLRRVIERTRRFSATLDKRLGTLRTEYDALAADIERLRERIPPDLFAKLERAIQDGQASVAKAQATLESARELFAAVDSGEGTIGALLNDPEFIDDAKKLGKILKRQPWRIIGPPQDP